MTTFILLLTSIFIVLLFASQVAGRLDKLHRRVSSARTTLWRRCNERYEAALTTGVAEIVDAANQAKTEASVQLFSTRHLFAESELTRILQQRSAELPIQLAQVRLQDARRMYNEAVRSTLYLRSWRIARWLRLSGRAIAPRYVDFDDSILQIF